MSNHYHVVLHVDKARALSWSDKEVVERWLQLYKGNALVNRWLQEAAVMSEAELAKVQECVDLWRQRLCDLSWFMRGVNETIACMANKEEQCKGRFWEGRFKSQALLDETAVLSCMAYVDLNPIRAGMESDLVDCDFTSIQQRLFEFTQSKGQKTNTASQLSQRIQAQQDLQKALGMDRLPEAPLMPFDGSSHTDIHWALLFTLEDYIELVDSTGRVVREDKRGAIPASLATLVSRLDIDPDQWLSHIQHLGSRYAYCVGPVEDMQGYADRFDLSWCKGVGASSLAYR